MTIDPADHPSHLSVRRALVVQCGADTAVEQACLAGRVEHVVSDQVTALPSLETPLTVRSETGLARHTCTVLSMRSFRPIGQRSVSRADHWCAGMHNSRARRLSEFDGIFPAADTPRLFNAVQLHTSPYQLSADRVSGLCGYSFCSRI
jgi:hypothetical protein